MRAEESASDPYAARETRLRQVPPGVRDAARVPVVSVPSWRRGQRRRRGLVAGVEEITPGIVVGTKLPNEKQQVALKEDVEWKETDRPEIGNGCEIG